MSRNNYGNRNYNQQRKGFQERDAVVISREIKNADVTLFKCLTKEDLYLPEGKAYKIANGFKSTKSNQIRKIYSMVKEAEELTRTDGFEKGLEKMFMILPLVAYAVGRELVEKDFFELMKVCINNDKLKSDKDIYTFSKFFESIVAYLKK